MCRSFSQQNKKFSGKVNACTHRDPRDLDKESSKALFEPAVWSQLSSADRQPEEIQPMELHIVVIMLNAHKPDELRESKDALDKR